MNVFRALMIGGLCVLLLGGCQNKAEETGTLSQELVKLKEQHKEEISQLKKEHEEEVQQLKKEYDKQIDLLNAQLSSLEGTVETYKKEILNIREAQKAMSIYTHNDSISQLHTYYKVDPFPKDKNLWWLVKKDATLYVRDYENAESVKFFTVYLGTDADPIEVGHDQNPSDGWSTSLNQKSLLDREIIWAEVNYSDGQTEQLPAIPFHIND